MSKLPRRKEWPKKFREKIKNQRLYGEMDILKRMSPSTYLWLIQYWDTEEGEETLKTLREKGAFAVAKLKDEPIV